MSYAAIQKDTGIFIKDTHLSDGAVSVFRTSFRCDFLHERECGSHQPPVSSDDGDIMAHHL